MQRKTSFGRPWLDSILRPLPPMPFVKLLGPTAAHGIAMSLPWHAWLDLMAVEVCDLEPLTAMFRRRPGLLKT